MDEMCNKSEAEGLSRTKTDVEPVDNVKRCASPVFKCGNYTKTVRGHNLDSSDYDIPSYQINQSAKSRTSSKYGSEANESLLPLSPLFSPILVASTQFQPPSFHSLGTIAKTLNKPDKNNAKSTSHNNRDSSKSCGLFQSLGMNDKDISWVSSMASPPPKQVPGSEFNTIEKATFFPEGKFQNIQPRALFSPNMDDDFGCHPISFCSESEDDEAYKSNIRLSDVCATLKQLEVKSVEQVTEHSAEIFCKEDNMISPVIKTKKKKPESVKKNKYMLIVSPVNEKQYEFSVKQNTDFQSNKPKSVDGSNFIEDDSFQTMSLSCIDELCKTLVTEDSSASTMSKLVVSDNNIVNDSAVDSKLNIPKIFYNSKAATDVFEAPSLVNLHSYAKALEEGDTYVPGSSKIDQSIADIGIVRLDILNKDPVKVDATKRLHSEVTEEGDLSNEKKLKKVEKTNENSGWGKVVEYLSESQLNVSDGEIFRTVENLEKTLVSQDSKDFDRLSSQQDCSHSQKSDISSSSKGNSGKMMEEISGIKDSSQDSRTVPVVAFTNVLGSKISVSKKALEKARDLLRDIEEEDLECKSMCLSGALLQKERNDGGEVDKCGESFGDVIVQEEEKSNLKLETSKGCRLVHYSTEARTREIEGKELMGGFVTGSGKQISISSKALERAREFMLECDGSMQEECKEEGGSVSSGSGKVLGGNITFKTDRGDNCSEFKKGKTVFEGFSTCTGKKIEVSAKSLERVKTLLADCDGSPAAESEKVEASFMKGFMTCSGQQVHVSVQALEKAKALMRECDESLLNAEKVKRGFSVGFSTVSGQKIEVSDKALEKAKALFVACEEEMKRSSSGRSSLMMESVVNEDFRVGFHSKLDVKEKKPEVVDEPAVVGFSTASGSKIKVSSKALEKAKSLWRDLEETEVESLAPIAKEYTADEPSTAEECKTEEILQEKARNKLESSEHERHFADSMETLMKSTSETSKLGDTGISEGNGTDDLDELIPGWLHVYTTSPSVTSDRTGLSPLVAQEDGKSSVPARAYIVKSPVLGSADRFHGKKRRRKLEFEEQKSLSGFLVPYKDSSRRTGTKRTSALQLDFSVPFKKVKFVEEEVVPVGCDVSTGRARRREEQEINIKSKTKVKPCKGTHLSKKCSEKQSNWKEAVEGCSPGVYPDEELKSLGVSDDVLSVNVRNAAAFTFNGERYFGPNCENNIEGVPVGDECVVILDDENKAGVEECKRAFLASPGVQPSLVPDGWVENHYKWIVWKLAHYEKSFPRHFAGRCLTPSNVMLQLKYRYDREIDRNERSALKKILERDDTSSKRLVLCVCGIEKVEVGGTSIYELSVTDGWYSCPARSDPAMTRLLEKGKLHVGTKIMTQGAVLINCEQGVSPLEMGGGIHLKISTNSTRRVRWYTKLGFQRNPKNFAVSLTSILPQGGPISRIDVTIVRVYPVLYMEKTPDGHNVTRNRRSEEKADAEHRRIQEQKMESICNEARLEMRKSVSSGNKSIRNCLNNIEQVEDLCELMGGSSDPSALQELMTADQMKLLENLKSSESDRLRRALSERIEKKLENDHFRKRNVSEFFRAKVVDVRKPDYNSPAVLTVWYPSEDLIALLTEGRIISLMNVTVSNSSRVCKPLQINTTRQTLYSPISQTLKYPARKLTQLRDVSPRVCPAFEEVDLVGMVLLIRDVTYGSRLSQVVYLTDPDMNFVGVVFWGSCKNYGWENVLRARCIVACSNLHWRKNYTSQEVPSLYASESSVFTENPKQSHVKEEMEKLKQNIPEDVATFLSKCEEELITRLEEPKWRGNSSKSLSADESSSREPNPRSNGFESRPTASSTPIKPFTGKITADEAEPSPIQKRIERLQCYGEPPPLIPLIIRNNVKRKMRKKTAVPKL